MEGLVKSLTDHYILFDNTYAGKTVLVTGHTGFKGSWLALWLHVLGAKVIGYALEPPTDPSMFDSINLSSKITHIVGDVRDFDYVSTILETYQPEIIFHLAAQPLVRLSYYEPRLTYETNVMGTVNLLEAVRHTPSVRVVVNITSDKCYDNKEWDYSYRENDSLGGFDPYSSSKGCAELVTSSYRNSFFSKPDGVRVASARAGNVVGGGDWAVDRIVPDCIRSLQANLPVSIRNPHAIRPWQHVLEPLSGYLWLGSLLWTKGQTYAGAWNFGPDSRSNITVQEVVEKIIKTWGSGTWQASSETGVKLHEARFLKLDCTKANNLLRWYPVYNIDQTLKVTTSWYREYYRRTVDMYDYSIRDIENYVRAALMQGVAWASSADGEGEV
ncbi:CDP-glucose 4,6-dehydratase [Moorella naiadis]|uniref:CDP-glucose 4,6-dehydratase n=1 Tax=Moorella naiadis (nom. illeg.) TaxID=3093670 RepID=UPI003D9CA392